MFLLNIIDDVYDHMKTFEGIRQFVNKTRGGGINADG